MRLQVCELGSTRYRDGLALMDALVAARAAGETGDWLLYPQHESVLTIGRNPSDGNVRADAATLAKAGIEVVERAVVRGGQIVAAPMMNAAIGFDHRVVDGELAVKFLRRVCELLEKPELLWFHA